MANALFSKSRLTYYLRGIVSSGRNYSDNKVVFTDDGSTVVCWHPEKEFPYEYTLPLPELSNVKTDSILRLQSREEVTSLLHSKKPEFVRKELMRITHTTKHRWFPKMPKSMKPKPPPDREYL